MTSYKRSIVTIGLSRTVSEINGHIHRKSPIFPTPVYLSPPMKGFLGIGYRRKGSQKLKWCGDQMVQKVLR